MHKILQNLSNVTIIDGILPRTADALDLHSESIFINDVSRCTNMILDTSFSVRVS